MISSAKEEFNSKPIRAEYEDRVEWRLDGKYHREDGPAIERVGGDKSWFINGKLHREDGPALEWSDGKKVWYINGRLHREDGPAVEWANGDKDWYINDNLHRVDGPAIEYANGDKHWYISGKSLTEKEFNIQMKSIPIRTELEGRVEWKLDGKLHREYGPAIEWASGDKEWWLNGNFHREDGPAVEDADGTKHWYINGKSHREGGPAVEEANGDKYWYINDNLHRVDGPAIEWPNGHKEWWLYGQHHREDGPAFEGANGDKYWYINGKCHREDGPAVERVSGANEWYLNNRNLTEEEFNIQMKHKPIRTEHKDFVEWTLDGKLHREDGPAIEHADGTKEWFINGKRHREDGPAKEWPDGKKSWYINDYKVKKKKVMGKSMDPDNTNIKKIFQKSAADVGASIASGIRLEAIERTNDNVYKVICQLLIGQLGVDANRLSSSIMKEAILTMIPLFLHPVAVAMDGKVAYAKWAKDYAETSLELSAKRNSGAIMDYLSLAFKLLYEANKPAFSKFTFNIDYGSLTKNKLRIIAKEKNLRIDTSQTKETLIDLLEQAELEDAGILEASN
ncbi:MAG: hypothetical protein Q8O87_02500 [bacterium]|nr:hypothetical protein [bacterium]